MPKKEKLTEITSLRKFFFIYTYMYMLIAYIYSIKDKNKIATR